MAGANWQSVNIRCVKCNSVNEFRIAFKAAQVKTFAGIFVPVISFAEYILCKNCMQTVEIPQTVKDALKGK